jgi:hypothetical protein
MTNLTPCFLLKKVWSPHYSPQTKSFFHSHSTFSCCKSFLDLIPQSQLHLYTARNSVLPPPPSFHLPAAFPPPISPTILAGLLISVPVNDLRARCEVGFDGRSFLVLGRVKGGVGFEFWRWPGLGARQERLGSSTRSWSCCHHESSLNLFRFSSNSPDTTGGTGERTLHSVVPTGRIPVASQKFLWILLENSTIRYII